MNTHIIEEYKARLARVFDFMGGVEKLAMDADQPELPDNGDLIPVADWVQMALRGDFIDYDGHGQFATQRPDKAWLVSSASVYPSDFTKFGLSAPEWATHVLWFNR